MRALASVLLLASGPAGADVTAPRVLKARYLPEEEMRGEPVDGFAWTVRMRRVFSSVEPIPVQWQLLNVTDRAMTVDIADAVKPRVVLTREGRDPERRPESDTLGYADRYGTIHPEAGSFVRRMDVRDLRFLFGRLAPGRYGLQLLYPAGGVVEKGSDGPRREMVSAVFEFEVRAASLREAETNNVHEGGVRIEPHWPVSTRQGTTTYERATIVNRSDRDVEIEGHIVADGKGEGISPSIGWTAWVPGPGWSTVDRSPWYSCGTGKTRRRLKPGESIDADLPGTGGDGIYRFHVPYGIPGEAPPRPHQARSRAVLVDTFDAAWKRALEKKK